MLKAPWPESPNGSQALVQLDRIGQVFGTYPNKNKSFAFLFLHVSLGLSIMLGKE